MECQQLNQLINSAVYSIIHTEPGVVLALQGVVLLVFRAFVQYLGSHSFITQSFIRPFITQSFIHPLQSHSFITQSLIHFLHRYSFIPYIVIYSFFTLSFIHSLHSHSFIHYLVIHSTILSSFHLFVHYSLEFSTQLSHLCIYLFTHSFIKLFKKSNKQTLKGIVSVISSDLPFKEEHHLLTMVPFKPLTDEGCRT